MSERGFYILKPPTDTYPALPENEHIVMLLAKLSKVHVGEFGLIRIEDGLAFLTKRFDRTEDGRKLHQEDCTDSQRETVFRSSTKVKFARTSVLFGVDEI